MDTEAIFKMKIFISVATLSTNILDVYRDYPSTQVHPHFFVSFATIGPPLDPELGDVDLPEAFGEQGLRPPDLPDYSNSNFKKAKCLKVDYGVSLTKSSLLWVTFRNLSLLDIAYKIRTPDFKEQYVCRPSTMCVLGYLHLSAGYVCIYSLAKKVLKVSDFEVLVNRDGFELLEWADSEKGLVPKNGIKSCEFNYIGRHKRYGLGNVSTKKKAFYLPWIQDKTEYWYSTYQVLTVVDESYNQELSQVHYLTEKANITRHKPHTMKTSRVTNNHNKEIKQTVSFTERTETVRTWETGFSTAFMLSTSVSAGIPNIGEVAVTVGVETSISMSKSNSESKSEEHSLSLEVTVPPGHYCDVRMVGTKMEAAIPFRAHVTKMYEKGRKHEANVTGIYKEVQVGEINGVVEQCVAISLDMVGTGRGAACHCTKASTLMLFSALLWQLWVLSSCH